MERGEKFDRQRRGDDPEGLDQEGLVPRHRREHVEQAQATLLSLLEELEAIIDTGTHIPLTPKVLVDRNLYLDTVDAIKVAVPEAVVQAERIVHERDEIRSQADAEAERIISQAKQEREFLISEKQLLRTAELQSRAIIEAAREEAGEIVSSAHKYASDLMAQLENEATRVLGEIRKTAGQMRRNSG
ncbi:MAG TPA: hypothetical protein VF960_04620 [Chloroflexota bacterium]